MKRMKRAIALLFCCAAACGGISLAACAEKDGAGLGAAEAALLESTSGYVVIEVREGDLTKSLYDALLHFQDRGELTIGGREDAFGFYLTSVNGVEATDKYYWGVYTTLGTLDGTEYSNAEYGTYEYGGQTLASASYGVSGLPLADGELYAVVWTKNPYA